MKNILKTSLIALIISLSTIGAYSRIGGGDLTSNWAEPPSGEVKGGKFMNLLNNIVVEDAVWDGNGNLTTSPKVHEATKADKAEKIVDSTNATVAQVATSTSTNSTGLKVNKIATGTYDVSDTHDIATPSIYANDADFTSVEASTADLNTITENGVAVLNQTESDARYLAVGASGDNLADNTIDSTEIEDNTLTASDLAANSVGNSEMIDSPTFSTVYAGSFVYSSDQALKEDIQVLSDALEKILQLEGVSFKWRENQEIELGLIAQNVEKVFPELVVINEETGMKAVKYGNLVAPLIEAVKTQQKEIENLKEEIAQLKNEN